MPEPDVIPAKRNDANQSGLMEGALLHDLVRWREALARSIARNNLELKSDQIASAVNRILFPLIFLRIAEDRHLLPAGTLAALGNFRTVSQLISNLAPYADAMYADDPADIPPHQDPGTGFVVDTTVVCSIFDVLLSRERRYDCGELTTEALSVVLMQYLTRTIRRSAVHQATVVDTHDAVVSGGTVIPPLPLVDYMVRAALVSARKNRSPREVLPLRFFDPACGAGTVLISAYRVLLEDAGGRSLTFEERREILVHSVYGLDLNRHAVAATRMLLFLELCDSPDSTTGEGDFAGTACTMLRDLRQTIICGNALVGPEIINDESWMFCPARDRHAVNPFSYEDRFPEIAAGGGFDAVVCNPPEGPLENREWIQQYFQRRYAVYHPSADRSAYFVEKSASLVHHGGIVSSVMSNRWLRGSAGSPLREVLRARQIEEIVDTSAVSAGAPGAGLCLVRVRTAGRPRSFHVVIADNIFFKGPDAYVPAHRFPVDQQLLDAGGWVLCDTRAEEVLRKVTGHSTPLEDYVMGQVHTGISVPDESPFLIERSLAREWLRRDPECKALLRPIITGSGFARYRGGASANYLLLVPGGWTRSHKKAEKKPWQWLKHRHPLIARHLQQFSAALKEESGPGALWWEAACDEFWQEPRKKIISPARFTVPAFGYDTGRGIADEECIALPSAGLYLAGILNSRLIAFIFYSAVRQKAPGRKIFSWNDLAQLPIYTPDLDRPEDRVRHERMETLVRRMLDLVKNCRAVKTGPEREILRKKIRTVDRQIDSLVYELYGLTPDEIAVVESNSPS